MHFKMCVHASSSTSACVCMSVSVFVFVYVIGHGLTHTSTHYANHLRTDQYWIGLVYVQMPESSKPIIMPIRRVSLSRKTHCAEKVSHTKWCKAPVCGMTGDFLPI